MIISKNFMSVPKKNFNLISFPSIDWYSLPRYKLIHFLEKKLQWGFHCVIFFRTINYCHCSVAFGGHDTFFFLSVGLEKKDTMNQARGRVGVREIAAGVNPATPVYGDNPGSKLDWWWWWWCNSGNDNSIKFLVLDVCAPSISTDFDFNNYWSIL